MVFLREMELIPEYKEKEKRKYKDEEF